MCNRQRDWGVFTRTAYSVFTQDIHWGLHWKKRTRYVRGYFEFWNQSRTLWQLYFGPSLNFLQSFTKTLTPKLQGVSHSLWLITLDCVIDSMHSIHAEESRWYYLIMMITLLLVWWSRGIKTVFKTHEIHTHKRLKNSGPGIIAVS